MKKIQRLFLLSVLPLMVGLSTVKAQENKNAGDSIKALPKAALASKEEPNRNVMLNAANNSGPRELNVGLPGSVGGTTILENDLPVVYYFWPELPNRAWRGSVSLGRSGLMGLQESSITTGDFGYAVNSYTRLGGEKTSVIANISGSHFGWIKADVNVSGALGNKWYFTAGVFQNYDPGSYDLKFTEYMDKTQVYRAGITKRFDKGEISLLYKYANSAVIPNYAVFRYQEGGSVEELNNFKIGRDSYMPRDGQLHMLDAISGEYYNVDMSKASDITTSSHNIDLLGNYKFEDNWKLKYTLRFRSSTASAFNILPTAIFNAKKADGFTYEDGTPYEGAIQQLFAAHSKKTPLTTIQSRFELSKKTESHNWKIGLTGAYFKEGRFSFNRSFFLQEVGPAPRRLYRDALPSGVKGGAVTDEYGFFNYNSGVPYHSGNESKITAFFSDDWKPVKWLDLNYGVNLRYHRMSGDYSTQRVKTPSVKWGEFKLGELDKFEHNWFDMATAINAVFKVAGNFGFTTNFIYTEKHGALEDYSATSSLGFPKTKSPYLAAGIYYNHPMVSVVSSVSYITRNNYQTRLNLVEPLSASEIAAGKSPSTQLTPVKYDIETIGWTTDVIFKPFKGFNLHALVTIQDPTYKNYKFEAFGKEYNYEGKNVLQISRFLLEVDPSYSWDKWRVWASARYFSKQYANLSNALYFKGWWETFGGVNYNMNKNIGFGLTVINPLNQRGAKGTINGAELITDPSPYYDRMLTSSYIRPFTVEGSINIKF